MVRYQAPLRDYKFLFYEVFDVIDSMQRLGYENWDRDLVDIMMEGFADLMQTTWLPVNEVGDKIGCRFENGQVTSPPGFIEAWTTTVEGDWFAAAL